jgi:tight adherence protein C
MVMGFNLFYVLFAITAFFAILAAFLVAVVQRQHAAVAKRISAVVVRPGAELEKSLRASEKVVRRVSLIASLIRMRLGADEVDETTQEKFLAAGIRVPRASDLYFVVRILSPAILIAIGYFASHNLLVGLGGGIVGYLGPSFALNKLVNRYRTKIRRALPDVVDLLFVCVDAGYGIDQAMFRTARELAFSYPEVCYELLETSRERQAGLSRAQSWENLVNRTKSEELDGLISMLKQADEFGTTLQSGLRDFSDRLRIQRRIDAEEQAAKATVILLVPLILFIFPTVFIVIMGPAVLTLMHSLSNGLIPK